MFGRVALAFLFFVLGGACPESAWAQTQICAADLDRDGDADSREEQGVCAASPAGHLCPIESVACEGSGGLAPPLAVASAIGTIVNDDARSGGAFNVQSTSVVERTGGITSLSVTVNFGRAPVLRRIDVVGSPITASGSVDYQMPPGQWLAPNASSLTFVVGIVADSVPESIESFQFVVWDATNPSATRSWGEIRIIDDDAPPPGVGISISSAWLEEGNAGVAVLNFSVTMSAASADTVTVDFRTADATAVANVDYTPVTGTLTFAPGTLAQTIQVPIVGDGASEADETFSVTLSNVTATGSAVCPLDPSRACLPDGAGGVRCSLHNCFLRSGVGGVIREPPSMPPNNDGPRDPSGNCLGAMRIFPGMYSRCRMVGTQTQFSNCCRHRGESMNDSMGVAGAVRKQADTMRSISTAASAAMTGGLTAANEVLAAAFDPTTFTIAIAMEGIAELLGEACDDRDIQTALLKDSGYCVLVGDYCAEEWPLVGCVQRAQGHCCYNSMLARIVNEQGRAQIPSIGGFGTPENPNCRGFSPEEFQAIDFSKVDLSEYFAEIRSKNQQLIEGEVRPRVRAQFGR
jgi:conjugal transfer mating pair stabilization protein TraN